VNFVLIHRKSITTNDGSSPDELVIVNSLFLRTTGATMLPVPEIMFPNAWSGHVALIQDSIVNIGTVFIQNLNGSCKSIAKFCLLLHCNDVTSLVEMISSTLWDDKPRTPYCSCAMSAFLQVDVIGSILKFVLSLPLTIWCSISHNQLYSVRSALQTFAELEGLPSMASVPQTSTTSTTKARLSQQ